MTKQDFDRIQKQYELLYNGKLEEKENTINTPNYYKLILDDLKEWLEERKQETIITTEENDYYLGLNYAFSEVLERLG